MPASYPNALKVFQTYHDYTDTIWAHSVNELHDEILAIENALGTAPFQGLPYTTFSGAIQDLYRNKAPANHTHVHSSILGDNLGNDHPQYIMISGYPGFSQPVTGKAGSNPADLVPLSQLTSFGYQNATQVENMVNAALGGLMAGVDSGNPPLIGSIARTGPAWRVQGGLISGATNGNGQIWVPFAQPYGNCLQAFTCTKIPPIPHPGPVQFPAPNGPYAWIEAQVTLYMPSGSGCWVQFSHDYSWQTNVWVSLTWMAMGT